LKKLSRRTLAAGRKLLIDQRAAEPAEYPPGPWILFEALTPAGLEMIEQAATLGNRQARIASLLGITAKQFENFLGAPDKPTPARLAFEAGDSKAESDLFVALHRRAAASDAESAKFLLRVRGHRESGPANIIEGPKIIFTLPGSFPPTDEGHDAYMRSIGQTEVHDARTTKLIREHMTMKGQSEAEITAYLVSIRRNPTDKDYVPKMIELNPPT
jgi:hypothetical protein